MQEAPHAGAEEGHHAGTQCPQGCGTVRVVATTTVDHVEGEDVMAKNGIGSSAEKIEPTTASIPAYRSRSSGDRYR